MSAAEQVAEYLELDDVTGIKKSKVSLCSMLKILPSVIAHYKSKVPGDLESGTRHQKESAAMYAWEPGLEIISVQGKYDTFRRKLLSAWTDLKDVSRSSAVQLSFEDRGKRMLPILERATHAMDWDVEGVWSQNCGRGVGRVLGWLPLLSRTGAIAHIKQTGKEKAAQLSSSAAKRPKALHLGANSEQHTWLPYGDGLVQGNPALLAHAGDIMSQSLKTGPATGAQWMQCIKKVETARTLVSCTRCCCFPNLTLHQQAQLQTCNQLQQCRACNSYQH